MDTLSIEGYTFLRELGSGAYGRVLLAERSGSSTLVAIKCFDPVNEQAVKIACSGTGTSLNDLQDTFLQYAQALRELPRREGLVAVLSTARTDDGLPFYISPYIPGCLADLLGSDVFDPSAARQLPDAQRPRRLKPLRVMQIFEQALVALSQMHSAGHVHHDIKPANLRMTAAGDLCLVDFSILKTSDGLAARGGFAPDRGCFDYTCPQLRKDPLSGEPSADLYSLACVCYRALTGTLPQGDFAEPAALASGLDAASNDLLLWMLASDADARPLDAATALDAYRSRHRTTHVQESEADTASAPENALSGGLASQVIDAQASDDSASDSAVADSDTPTRRVETIAGPADRDTAPESAGNRHSDVQNGRASMDTQVVDRAVAGNEETQLMAKDPGEARTELHRQIANLIDHQGRVDAAGRCRLHVLCDIAGISAHSLDEEIAEVLASDSTLAAKERLAQRISDLAVGEEGAVDQGALKELLEAARQVGWDMQDLLRIAGSDATHATAPGPAPSWRKPEQRRPAATASKGGKGGLIAVILGVVAVLAIGGFITWQWLAREDTPVPIAQAVPIAEGAADRARMQTQWDLAMESNSLEGFQGFVDNWPNSPFVDRALAQIAQIAQIEQIEQIGADRQSQAALERQREQTQLAVQATLIELGYLDPQLESEPDVLAAAISEFEIATGLPRRGEADDTTLIALRAERTQREDQTWIAALEADGETAYLAYRERYPDGRYAVQAEQKLADLQQRAREQTLAEQLAAEESAEQRAAAQAEQRRQAAAARTQQQQRLAEQRSQSIEQIQGQLRRLGFDLQRSGELDPATREALTQLQQPADGGLDLDQLEAVLATLSALPEPSATASDEPFVPVILRRVEPSYPRRAAREGTEGWLEAELSVDEQGQVVAISTVDSSHRRVFDREVEQAVRQWRFEPRIVDGDAVPFTIRQRFDFSLDGR